MEHIEFVCEGVPKFTFTKDACDNLNVIPWSFHFTRVSQMRTLNIFYLIIY